MRLRGDAGGEYTSEKYTGGRAGAPGAGRGSTRTSRWRASLVRSVERSGASRSRRATRGEHRRGDRARGRRPDLAPVRSVARRHTLIAVSCHVCHKRTCEHKVKLFQKSGRRRVAFVRAAARSDFLPDKYCAATSYARRTRVRLRT